MGKAQVKLFILRHGEAVRIASTLKDSDRNLTKQGITSITSAASNWKGLISKPDFIVCSPYLRTRQTAEIATKILEPSNELITDIRLVSGTPTQPVIDLINELDAETIMLVGHEPDCSRHVSTFTSNSGMHIQFSTGTLAGLHFPGKVRPGSGLLYFLLPVDAW